MFYIMAATQALFNKARVKLNELLTSNEFDSPMTLLICEREFGYGTFKRVIVSGSGVGYRVVSGTESKYTEDTGNGLRNKNKRLNILNVIEIAPDVNKKMVITRKENDIGINESIPLWVMK